MPIFPKNPTPKQLLDAYKEGFIGSIRDPNALDKLLGELPHPLFGAASTYKKGSKIYSLAGSGDKVTALLYKYARSFDNKLFEDEAQQTGDCVSHAVRNACDITRAVEILLYGEAEDWMARSATEMIYKYRGHNGQGMSCSVAVKFVNSAGGVLLRKNYPELGIDLSKYNYKLGVNGRQGISPIILAEARKHQIKTISLITSVEEACDAIANGYGVHCCSGQGFSSKRDSEGFSKPSGSWSHAMAWTAVDTEYTKRPGILIQNSLGVFNSGPTRHEQPKGSFWVDLEVCEKMIKNRGCWATSNFEGFPAQKLPPYVSPDVLL